MEQAVTATLPLDDLAELDRVCRDHGVSRHEAVESAVRWYIGRGGDLPSVDDLDDEIELP
jgi:metal-responsive CopG/Arc/MetJ family transcriptional regulator